MDARTFVSWSVNMVAGAIDILAKLTEEGALLTPHLVEELEKQAKKLDQLVELVKERVQE